MNFFAQIQLYIASYLFVPKYVSLHNHSDKSPFRKAPNQTGKTSRTTRTSVLRRDFQEESLVIHTSVVYYRQFIRPRLLNLNTVLVCMGQRVPGSVYSHGNYVAYTLAYHSKFLLVCMSEKHLR